MNDEDYRSSVECLKIAIRLILPLPLEAVIARLECRPSDDGLRFDDQSCSFESVKQLAGVALRIRDELSPKRD